MRAVKTFSTVIALVILAGCFGAFDELEGVDTFEFSPEYAFPVINSDFAFEDFIEEVDSSSLIEVSEDGLISLIYESDLQTQVADELYTIPNQDFSAEVNLPNLGDLPIQGTIRHEDTYTLTFDGGGSSLDSIILKEGAFDIIFSTDMQADGIVTLTIPSLLVAGSPYQAEFQWSSNQAPYQQSINLDLNGAKLDLTEGGADQNTFSFNISAEITYTGNTVSSANQLSVSMELAGPKFARMHGSIASIPIQTNPDTLEVTFFQNIEEGLFGLEDPQIEFMLNNSFGIPLDVDFSRIKSKKGFSQELNLSGAITDSPVEIAFPTIDELGQTKTTEVMVNAGNSNLADLINLLPDEFIYQFAGVVNPDNLSSLYLLDTSKVDIDYRFRLPLFGWVDGLELEQDFSFDGGILDGIDEAKFQVRTENELPIGMDLQVYFLDNGGNVLDSLVSGDRTIITAAEVDVNGKSSSSETMINVYTLDPARTAAIKNAENIRVWIRTSTTNSELQQSVQILSTDKIELAIGLQVAPDFNE